MLSGSTWTDTERLAWKRGNRCWVGDGLVGGSSFGSKTGVTWQKCSWCLSVRCLVDRFGTSIPRTTLETTLDCGHSWEGLRFRKVGASVRGSSAYSESGGASSGSCTSRNSQRQTVFGRNRSTEYKGSAKGCEGTGCGLGPVCADRAIAK